MVMDSFRRDEIGLQLWTSWILSPPSLVTAMAAAAAADAPLLTTGV